jgi:hypothetical protein
MMRTRQVRMSDQLPLSWLAALAWTAVAVALLWVASTSGEMALAQALAAGAWCGTGHAQDSLSFLGHCPACFAAAAALMMAVSEAARAFPRR